MDVYLPVVPLIRIYFNKRCNKPWSVDFGPGTKEYTVADVTYSNMYGRFVFDKDGGDNIDTPTAYATAKNSSFNYFETSDKINIGSLR